MIVYYVATLLRRTTKLKRSAKYIFKNSSGHNYWITTLQQRKNQKDRQHPFSPRSIHMRRILLSWIFVFFCTLLCQNMHLLSWRWTYLVNMLLQAINQLILLKCLFSFQYKIYLVGKYVTERTHLKYMNESP